MPISLSHALAVTCTGATRMQKRIVSDFCGHCRYVVPSHSQGAPETAAAGRPFTQSLDLPTDEAGWRVYILDYFQELGVPKAEASPLLDEALAKAKEHLEVLLFILTMTGTLDCLADWLALVISGTALEIYIWSQHDSLIQKFRKNRRYGQDAGDLAHDTILKAIKAIWRGSRPKSALKGWLSRLATYTLIDHHRKESRRQRKTPEQEKKAGTNRSLLQRSLEPNPDPTEQSDNGMKRNWALLQEPQDPDPMPFELADSRMKWEQLITMLGEKVVTALLCTAEGCEQDESAKKCGVTSDRTIRRWLKGAALTVKTLFAS
jgi:RNA polymerase sigma factor (sigma-70 family)